MGVILYKMLFKSDFVEEKKQLKKRLKQIENGEIYFDPTIIVSEKLKELIK